MNYIFLDIDGVLNNIKHYSKQHKKYGGRYICEQIPFNPRSLKNLHKLIRKTKAKIVLTSSWRNYDTTMIVLNARLKEYGLKIFSVTPYLEGRRGKEIKSWCKSNISKNDSILIIDDEIFDILDYYQEKNILKINPYYGLTFIKYLEAVNKFRKKEGNKNE